MRLQQFFATRPFHGTRIPGRQQTATGTAPAYRPDGPRSTGGATLFPDAAFRQQWHHTNGCADTICSISNFPLMACTARYGHIGNHPALRGFPIISRTCKAARQIARQAIARQRPPGSPNRTVRPLPAQPALLRRTFNSGAAVSRIINQPCVRFITRPPAPGMT